MDLLEIFRVDVKVNEVVLFYIRQKIHFRSVKMAVFRGFFKEIFSVNVFKSGYR